MRPSFLSSTRISHLALCEEVNARIAGCDRRMDDTSKGRKTFVKDTPGAIPWQLQNRSLHCAQGRIRHNSLRSAFGTYSVSFCLFSLATLWMGFLFFPFFSLSKNFLWWSEAEQIKSPFYETEFHYQNKQSFSKSEQTTLLRPIQRLKQRKATWCSLSELLYHYV